MRSPKFLVCVLALAPLAASAESADPHAGHHAHANGPPNGPRAPIGVMGDHMHPAGGFMVSYRYGFMDMDGHRDGSHRVSTREVLSRYMVSPLEMDMQMHMVGLMWAPLDALTLELMVPYVRVEMNHRTRMGMEFTTRGESLGDVSLAGLVRLLDRDAHHVHVSAGVSAPTGSYFQRDKTPMGRVRLPYPMQIGSGTWDLRPGLTYTGVAGGWSWGAQGTGTVRTGRNDLGYRRGNAYELTSWLSRDWTDWLATSLRFAWRQWLDIEGDDDSLMPRMVPTADPDLRAGRRLDALLGLAFRIPRGPLAGNRLGVEAGLPVYQHLDGPQLEADWRLVAGWQYAF